MEIFCIQKTKQTLFAEKFVRFEQQEQKADYMQPVREWWPSFSSMFADSNEAMGNLLRIVGARDMKSLSAEQADKAVAYMAQRYYEAQDAAQD